MRLVLFVGLLLAAGTAQAQLAGCSGTCPIDAGNHHSFPAQDGQTGTQENGNNFVITLPNNVGSGNLVWCALSHASGSTLSFTDSISADTAKWTKSVAVSSAQKSITSEFWYKANSTGGLGQFTIAGTANTQLNGGCGELRQAATSSPIDATFGTADVHTVATSVTLAAGSVSVPTANDALIYAAFDVLGPISCTVVPCPLTSGFSYTPGTSWNVVAGNPTDGYLIQAATWGSSGTLNPSATVTSGSSISDYFNVIAIAVKGAVAGTTPPAGIRVTNAVHFELPTGTSATYQFGCPSAPAQANLLVFAHARKAASDPVSAVSDNVNGSWTLASESNTLFPRYAYFANATTNGNMTLTVTHNSVSLAGVEEIYCVSGAATSQTPVDATPGTCSASGCEPSAPFPYTISSPTITPSANTGLVIAFENMVFGPVLSVTPNNSSMFFDNIPYTGETDSGDTNSGDAILHYYNPDSSPITFGWVVGSASNASGWNTRAVMFQAAPAGGGSAHTWGNSNSWTSSGSLSWTSAGSLSWASVGSLTWN